MNLVLSNHSIHDPPESVPSLVTLDMKTELSKDQDYGMKNCLIACSKAVPWPCFITSK